MTPTSPFSGLFRAFSRICPTARRVLGTKAEPAPASRRTAPGESRARAAREESDARSQGVQPVHRHRRLRRLGPARRGRQLRHRPRAAAARQGRAGHRQDPAGHARRRRASGFPWSQWHIKSTSKASEGLYVYDTLQRLNDARFGEGDVGDIRHYIKLGPLGRVFAAEERHVLLIDEVDKADLEFPNDILRELDEMRFTVMETGDEIVAAAAAGGHHHVEQREGAARRLPAPLRVPLHRVPGRAAHEEDRRRAPPEPRHTRCSTRC